MEWCGEVNFVWINYRVKILVLSTSRVQLVKFVAVKAVFVLLSFFLSFFFISLFEKRCVGHEWDSICTFYKYNESGLIAGLFGVIRSRLSIIESAMLIQIEGEISLRLLLLFIQVFVVQALSMIFFFFFFY